MLLAPPHKYCRRTALTLFWVLACFSSIGHAQAPAALMPSADSPYPEVVGARWTRIEGASGRKFLTAVLRPEGVGPFPVVVVLHNAGGLTRGNLSVAEDIARAGFLVVYGCWQAGNRQNEGNRLCSEATPQAEWAADPAAHSGKELIALARTLPDARADRIGLFGISRGGYAALFAASTGADVQAVVVDAPVHTASIDPRPSKTTVDVLAGLSAPLLMMHGTADLEVSVEQSREYEQAARAHGKPIVAVYFDGLGHQVSLIKESQAEARQRSIAFLREHLFR